MRFGLDRAPNFEGRWHLHVFADPATIATARQDAYPSLTTLLVSAQAKLLDERARA